MSSRPNLILSEELSFLFEMLKPYRKNTLHSQISFGLDYLMPILAPELKDIIDEIYFPDAYIFSSRTRLVDLYQKKYYACYSQYAISNVYGKLSPMRSLYCSPTPILVSHPFTLLQSLIRDHKSKPSTCRKKNVLLIYPKSAPSVRREVDNNALISVIRQLRNMFEEVNLLAYYKDLDDNRLEPLCNEIDNLFSAGDRYDPLFYPRLVSIYNRHECIASPQFDVSLLYASAADCTFCYTPLTVSEFRTSAYQNSRLPSRKHMKTFTQLTSKLRPFHVVGCEDFRLFLDAPQQLSQRNMYGSIQFACSPSPFFRIAQFAIKLLDRVYRLAVVT